MSNLLPLLFSQSALWVTCLPDLSDDLAHFQPGEYARPQLEGSEIDMTLLENALVLLRLPRTARQTARPCGVPHLCLIRNLPYVPYG